MDSKIEARFKATARSKTFRNLRTYAKLEEGAVVDLGCSYGEFLAHFGPGSIGVTIQERETEQATNLDIRLGNVEDADFSLDRKFDAIFANNLFEHLYSPHAFLIKAKEFITPDGVLVLGVPCIPRLSFLMRFGKFRGSLSPEHINFFNKKHCATRSPLRAGRLSACAGLGLLILF